jgi:hypothetical protein
MINTLHICSKVICLILVITNKGQIMAIVENQGGTMYTGNDITRYQVTVLNHGVEFGRVNKSKYFETMFHLYRNGNLHFNEVAELFRFATKYKRSSNPIMNNEEKELRQEMITKWFDNKGEWLVDIDELEKNYNNEGE